MWDRTRKMVLDCVDGELVTQEYGSVIYGREAGAKYELGVEGIEDSEEEYPYEVPLQEEEYEGEE